MTFYDGLFTLRCTPSTVPGTGLLDLHEADAVGNPLHRPQIDEADPAPLYSLGITGSSSSTPSSSTPPTTSAEGAYPSLALLDSLSTSSLSNVSTLSTNKLRLITLHNPTQQVEIKNKSLLSFEWSFEFQGNKFVWNRSRDSLSTRDSGYTCKLVRKPDPDVAVMVYKLAKKGNLIQILDYNISRFEIEDRKGLEILLLSTLFSLVYSDQLDISGSTNATSSATTNGVSPSNTPPVLTSGSYSQRPIPKRTSSEDEVETKEDAPNEIVISSHLSEGAYVTHCLNMLSDPTLIYLTLVARTDDTVPRAISIASETKRRKLKEGREDLMQFIDYPGRAQSVAGSAPKPRRNSSNERAAPPSQIKVYLSRIPLEELTPRRPTQGHSTRKESLDKVRDRNTLHKQGPPVSAAASQRRSSQPSQNRPPPPLPPKTHPPPQTSGGDDDRGGRLKGFWHRAMSG